MTQNGANISREALCIWDTLRMTLCLQTSSHNILVPSVAIIMVLDNPGKCSLNKSRKIQSASVPWWYITRRNERCSKPHCNGHPRAFGWKAKRYHDKPGPESSRCSAYVCKEQSFTETEPHDVNWENSKDRREGEGAYRRSIIPIPREATSVATMMGLFPVLNSLSTQSRSFCCLSP